MTPFRPLWRVAGQRRERVEALFAFPVHILHWNVELGAGAVFDLFDHGGHQAVIGALVGDVHADDDLAGGVCAELHAASPPQEG